MRRCRYDKLTTGICISKCCAICLAGESRRHECVVERCSTNYIYIYIECETPFASLRSIESTTFPPHDRNVKRAIGPGLLSKGLQATTKPFHLLREEQDRDEIEAIAPTEWNRMEDFTWYGLLAYARQNGGWRGSTAPIEDTVGKRAKHSYLTIGSY